MSVCLCTRITLTIKNRKDRQPPRSLPTHPPCSPQLTNCPALQPVSEFSLLLSRLDLVPSVTPCSGGRLASFTPRDAASFSLLGQHRSLRSPQPRLTCHEPTTVTFPFCRGRAFGLFLVLRNVEATRGQPCACVSAGDTRQGPGGSGSRRPSGCPHRRRRRSAARGRSRCSAPAGTSHRLCDSSRLVARWRLAVASLCSPRMSHEARRLSPCLRATRGVPAPVSCPVSYWLVCLPLTRRTSRNALIRGACWPIPL